MKAQRERALRNTVGRGRAATPSMSHAGLIDLTESTMGLSRVRESPSDYRSWRGWTSGQSGDAVGDGMSSYALRDIKAGEELTDDYATFEELRWFEAMCEAHGAASCVAVGRAHR